MPYKDPEKRREHDKGRVRPGKPNPGGRRRYYADNHDRIRDNQTRYAHGIGEADKLAMLQAQGGQCYLCGDPLALADAVIDHDHRCCKPRGSLRVLSCAYCRRGLSCGACNTVIGMAQDDPERLRRIADNLAAILPVVNTRLAARPQQGELLDLPEAS